MGKGLPAEFIQADHEALVVRMQESGNEVSTECAQVSLGIEASQHCLSADVRVCLVGLQNRPELNGCRGLVREFQATAQRWTVRLDSTGEVINVNPQNLSVLLAPSAEPSKPKMSAHPMEVGTRVRLEGLQSRQDLNGCQGSLTECKAR